MADWHCDPVTVHSWSACLVAEPSGLCADGGSGAFPPVQAVEKWHLEDLSVHTD